MTDEQFEQHIAEVYRQKGYDTKLTSKSYDYGVDVIATNEYEKIAIQVKMYKTRLVNYKAIFYLYAGKDFYDCDKALLITAGSCDSLAIKAAVKLGVGLQEHFEIPLTFTVMADTNSVNPDNDFDTVWEKHIKTLKGKEIFTATGKRNVILDVTNNFLIRESANGAVSKIEKRIFKTVYYRLKENKILTRKEINTEYENRGSAMICAVLAKVPFITLTEKPNTALSFRN